VNEDRFSFRPNAFHASAISPLVLQQLQHPDWQISKLDVQIAPQQRACAAEQAEPG
jgi:hypothetical protein